MRSRADLLGVFVRPSDDLTAETSTALAGQVDLLQSLGGRYHEVVGDDVATSLIDFAKAENATQLVLGASRRSRTDCVGAPLLRGLRQSGWRGERRSGAETGHSVVGGSAASVAGSPPGVAPGVTSRAVSAGSPSARLRSTNGIASAWITPLQSIDQP